MSKAASTKRPIIGESKPILEMTKMIQKVASAKTSILIIGESGTGKELVARMIHEQSPLHEGPFIAVNCGAIPETLIESEMFGHKRGSFTGAVSDKVGLFEAANNGTLFLDEIGELPLSMQVKLLRALQEKVIRRVGGNDDIRIDARILAATNRDLEAAVKKGTFREDLYYRLNVIMIRTPPLRERGSDIQLLIESFLKKFSVKQKKELKGIEPDTLKVLMSYAWPGNVRELENTIERMVTLENAEKLTLAGLPPAIQDSISLPIKSSSAPSTSAAQGTFQAAASSVIDFSSGPVDLEKLLSDIEKAYLLSALEHSKGVRKKAASLLGMTFRSFRYRMEKLGLDSGNEEE